MSRAQFRQLQRDQRLRDRRGREWTVTAGARAQDGVAYVMIRAGDLVRRVDERWADEYQLLGASPE
jgi:hypothetical protein